MRKIVAVFIASILVIAGCKKFPPEFGMDKLKPAFVNNLNGWTVVAFADNMGFSNTGKSKIGKVVEHPDGTMDVIYGSWNQKGVAPFNFIELDQFRTLFNVQQNIDTTHWFQVSDINQKQYAVFESLDTEIYGKGIFDFKTWGFKGIMGYNSPGNSHYLTKHSSNIGGGYTLHKFYLFHENLAQNLMDSAFVTDYGTTSYTKYPIGTGKHENLLFSLTNETFYNNNQNQTLLFLYATNSSKVTYNVLNFDLSEYIPGYSPTDVVYHPIPSYYQFGEELYFNIFTSTKVYNFSLNLKSFTLQLKHTYTSTLPSTGLSIDNHKIQWVPNKFNAFLAMDVQTNKIDLYENGSIKSIPTPFIDYTKVLINGNMSYGDFKYESETNTIYMLCNGYLFARKL
jgi:hypothetical protein